MGENPAITSKDYLSLFFTVTKLSNISGVATTDAKKSLDMYLKCNYLNEINKGRCGIVFATGTSISNSMTELFTLQRYLAPDRLKEKGLEYFDAWASTFGKIVTNMELSPEGKGFRPKERFSKFYNLPELMSMFREFADIKMPDQLNLDVPEAKKEIINMKPSNFQKEYVNSLADRAARIRGGGVNPEDDNMLLITSEGRKLALDQRLINPDLPDDPNSKVNHCVKQVLKVHEKHPTEAQLIFCDMSTPSKEFNVYDDIKQKLVAGGLQENEVAFIQDAKTEKQKDALFQKVRSGQVKVLLGSTSMMGTGTNVQDHLIACHDLDIPWRPSDLEQRSGRIIRQGNQNKNVEIYRYVTEGTFDAYLWQIIENKQRFISQVLTSRSIERSAEDVDDATLSFAEIKAIATGNPLIKEKMDIDMRISRLRSSKETYLSGQENMRRLLDVLPRRIEKNKEKLALYEEKAKAVQDEIDSLALHGKTFSMEINGITYDTAEGAAEAIQSYKKSIGSLAGLKGKCFGMSLSTFIENSTYQLEISSSDGKVRFHEPSSIQYSRNVELILDLSKHVLEMVKRAKEYIERDTLDLASAKEEYGKPFSNEDELQKLTRRSLEIEQLLNGDEDGKEQDVIELQRKEREERIYGDQTSLNDISDPVEKMYLTLARKVEKGTYDVKKEYSIINFMVQQNAQKEAIYNTVMKCSPLLSESERVEELISHAFTFSQKQKAAAR